MRYAACALIPLALALASPAHAQPTAERWDPPTVRQKLDLDALVYASGARASSEYSSSYGAATAQGRPNVWPTYRDRAGAWAPKDKNSATEWLEVTFAPTEATAIYIFETCNAGAIRSVVDGEGAVLYQTDAPAGSYRAAQVLAIPLPASRRIAKLKIAVDGSRVSGWAEIDAVGLAAAEAAAPPASAGPAASGAAADPAPRAAPGQALGVGERWGPEAVRKKLRLERLVYATGAEASSAYFGYEARKATGAPEVWPKYADERWAWAPKARKSKDWLEVTFPTTEAAAIYVFETYSAGAIVRVTDGEGALLYQATGRAGSYDEGQVLAITLPAPRSITKLKIEIDGARVFEFAEIDAVALAPPARERPSVTVSGTDAERLTPERAEYRVPLDTLVFASGAAASSEYMGYEAAQATGRPNVWPGYGDDRFAWAPKEKATEEWLEVTFPATETRWVYVFETCEAGAIRSVTDGEGAVLYSTDAPAGSYSEAQLLAITLPEPRTISKLRIEIDGARVPEYAEIDAVALGMSAPIDVAEQLKQHRAELTRWQAIYDRSLDWEEKYEDEPAATLAKAKIQRRWFEDRAALEAFFARAERGPLGEEQAFRDFWGWVQANVPKTFAPIRQWARFYDEALAKYTDGVTREQIASHYFYLEATRSLKFGINCGACLVAWHRGFGQEAKAKEYEANIARLVASRDRIERDYASCVREFNRMPEGVDEPKLLAIALETVKARCKAPWRALRVTSPKRRAESSSSWWEGDVKMVKKWKYDCFDAAWAEQKEDGRWTIATATVAYLPVDGDDFQGPHEWKLEGWSWDRHIAEEHIPD